MVNFNLHVGTNCLRSALTIVMVEFKVVMHLKFLNSINKLQFRINKNPSSHFITETMLQLQMRMFHSYNLIVLNDHKSPLHSLKHHRTLL